MYENNKEQFGTFIAELRKQKGYTQKILAEKLFVSDKAVSKWERGISLPDIMLLKPLADILGVAVTELLQGDYINEDKTMTKEEVEVLVSGSIELSMKEQENNKMRLKRNILIYVPCLILVLAEIYLLMLRGFTTMELMDDVFVTVFLNLLFGGFFLFVVKETLPAYYDENKISFYSQRGFRMNLIGVNFNNNNWPYILHIGRIWTLGTAVVYPIIYLMLRTAMSNYAWNKYNLFFQLFFVLYLFIPMIIVGKKYE